MSNNNFYAGGGLNISGAPLPQLQAHGVEAFAQEDMLRASVNRGSLVSGVQHEMEKLKDYKARASAKSGLDGIDRDVSKQVKLGLESAPGSANSFYFEDGRLDEAKITDLATQTAERLRGINPTFFSQDMAAEWEVERDDYITNLADRIKGQADLHELSSIRRASDAALAVDVANGNLAGASRELDRQVAAGILTPKEAQLKKIQMGRGSLGRAADSGEGINVGGVEYAGLDAALAASAAREGWQPGQGEDDSAQIAADAGAELAVQDANAQVDALPTSTLSFPASAVQPDTGAAMHTMTLAPAELWAQQGDYSGIIRTMPGDDFSTMINVLTPSCAVTSTLRPDGTTELTPSATAPESMRRLITQANELGNLDADTARSVVANLVFAAVRENTQVEVGSLVAMFDKSGIFERLGEGDAAVGKERVRAICQEFRDRATIGTTKLNMDNIERIVDRKLQDESFGEGQEWKTMEGLLPPKTYKKPSDEEGRKRWFTLYHIYEKYRPQFNPAQAAEELTKEEFAANAHAFYKWYMTSGATGSGIYARSKKAYTKAAKDWYMATVMDELIRKADIDGKGKANYGQREDESYISDVSLAKDVLRRAIPSDLGTGAMERKLADDEKRDAALSAKWREKAKADAKRLKAAKARKAADAAAAEEKEARRKEDEAAAKKEAEEAEEVRVARGRNGIRYRNWEWDCSPSVDGERPRCSIPEAEYRELKESLGYDGSQLVYIIVNGEEIQVTGHHKGKGIKFNSAAVYQMQPKHRKRKKGEAFSVHGTLEYSYKFKKING